MSSDLEQIKAKIVATDAELGTAKRKLEEAVKSGDQRKIAKYEDDVKRKENLLIEQQKEKNILLAGPGTTIS